jgi:Flp pilus assembly protein TadG
MTEMAVVSSVLFVLILGTIVGALGVSRYQQVSSAAREAARYASVHGGQHQQDTGLAATSASDIYTNAIAPRVAGLNLQQSNVTISLKTWKLKSNGKGVKAVTKLWDDPDPNGYPFNNYPFVVDSDTGGTITTSVVVTITYTWAPELFGGSVTMTSTSELQMAY